MKRLGLSLLMTLCAIANLSAQGKRTPRIAMIVAHNHQALLASTQPYAGKFSVDVFGTGNEHGVRSARGLSLNQYDLVFAEGGGSQFLFLIEELEAAKARTQVLIIRSELARGSVDPAKHPWIEKYWAAPSATNLDRLLSYLGNRLLGLPLGVAPPLDYPDVGFYHPRAPSFFPTLAEYRKWHEGSQQKRTGQRFAIGISFNSLDHLRGQLSPVDALIEEIERRGHIPVPLMYTGPMPLEMFRAPDGRPGVDTVITTSTRVNWQNSAAGALAAKRLDVPLLLGANHSRLTPDLWRESKTGFAPDMTSLIAMSERDGLIEPLAISTRVVAKDGDNKAPLAEQVAWRVRRALAWAALRQKPNAEKRIVVTFHAEGGGKGDVGSDLDEYLDVQGSLVQIMKQMQQRGYNLGDGPIPDVAQISRDLALRASNIGNWAPGEIAKRAASGDADLIPEELYLRWFAELPKAKREQVVATWGPPPGKIMVHTDQGGRRFLVMPKLVYGNLVIVPHPDWGILQEKRAMFAKTEVAPNHQYIAFFLWLQKRQKPDAWLSLFSNIVLQGGKMLGPAAGDWTAILQGDMPHLRTTPLHGNGGMMNKRRALAVTPTFSPDIVYSDLYGGLLELADKLGRYKNQEDGALRASYAQTIRAECQRLRLDRDLGLDAKAMPVAELVEQLDAYLAQIRRQSMPAGSHVLGRGPTGSNRVEMVTAMLGSEYTRHIKAKDIPAAAQGMVAAVINGGRTAEQAQQSVLGQVVPALHRELARAVDYAARLDRMPEELPRILDVLDGRYLEPGPVNDPVRNPDALPSGRNAYVFDPAAMPTREAWATAGRLVDQLLRQYRAKHGRLPRKVGFVLWSGEAVTNLGVTEAQMLQLLGVRPVWSANGRVADVELIPAAELGRPRVDVFATASGTYRDNFYEKMVLLDKAVKLAAAAKDEPGNLVAQRTAEVRADMLAAGETAKNADVVATARIFSEAVGAYSPNIQFLAKSGDYYESAKQMTELYNSRLSHVYGEGELGTYHRAAFTANLKTLDAAAFSRSSSVMGTLEHPMVAAYFGGMSMATEGLTGKAPEMYITNLSDPAAAATETLSLYFNRELRSRYFNPKWVRKMMASGYEGARFPAAFASNLHLWDVTRPDLVTSDHWREARDVYIRDKHQLGLSDFFEKHNPFAKQGLTATLLDAAIQGEWDATDEEKAELAATLAQSAKRYGLACEADICRNKVLANEVRKTLLARPETAPLVTQFNRALQTVQVPAGGPSPVPSGARSSQAPAPTNRAAGATAAAPVEGRVMETVSAVGKRLPALPAAIPGIALFACLLLAFGWWRQGK